MFVDRGRTTGRIFKDAPGFHHRSREMARLVGGHPAEEHGHGPRTHLILRDFAGRETSDEEVDLVRAQLSAFALLFDQSRDVHSGASFSLAAVMTAKLGPNPHPRTTAPPASHPAP